LRSPLILDGKEIQIEERSPPPTERRRAHKWLGEEALARYKGAESEGLELFVSKVAEEKMRNHALRHADEKKEVMGLMLGWIFRNGEREYAVVRDVVTTDLDSSSVHVRFDREGFEKLFASLEESGFNYLIVGWYHSHPGHGCFMSSTDVETQRTLFGRRHHSAIVIDPVNKAVDAFFLDGGTMKVRDFAVYWDEYESPYHGTSVRTRRVRSDPDCVPSAE